MPLLADNLSWGTFILGLLLMTFVLLRRSRRYYADPNRHQSASNASQADFNRDSPLIDAPIELNRWHVEMHDVARELKAEIDSKMVALQVLTRNAQEETERLHEAIRRAEELGIAACRDPLAEIEGLLAGDSNLDQVVEHLDAAADTGACQPGGSPEQLAIIYAMADQGAGFESIASRIGAPVGDVEMALSLRTTS